MSLIIGSFLWSCDSFPLTLVIVFTIHVYILQVQILVIEVVLTPQHILLQVQILVIEVVLTPQHILLQVQILVIEVVLTPQHILRVRWCQILMEEDHTSLLKPWN